MNTLYVSPNDASAFPTIMDALSVIPATNKESITIQIAPGVYDEEILISSPYVTLQGESPETTIITHSHYANDIMSDGSRRGTFRSYTLLVLMPDVTLRNLTIANDSGPSKKAGQAIALYANGDRFSCDNCHIVSCQDTLFTGPLPEKEYEPNGFRGPTEFAPRTHTRGYYKDCLIRGDIDFIFGGGAAYFDHCELQSVLHDSNEPIQGYVTAASTPADQPYGYVFSNCKFTSSECPNHSVYLGRPWRDYARTVFLNCEYGPHIHPEGFHDWNKKHARETVFYAEYQDPAVLSSNIDFSKRAPFVRQLTKKDTDNYDLTTVLGGWNPLSRDY